MSTVQLDISASDTEPGAIIVTIADHDGTTIIRLSGDDLQRFISALATAMITAFADHAMAAMNAIDQRR